MNGYQIVRNFNISYLTDSEMDGIVKDIYNYLENLFTDLNIYTCDDYFYKNKKYFGKTKSNLIIGFELTQSEVWIYKKVWKYIYYLFNLTQESTEIVIKWYLTYRFNLNIEICEVYNITCDNSNNISLDIK